MGDVIELHPTAEVRCSVIDKELWIVARYGEHVVLALPSKGKALAFALSPESARELAQQLLAKAGEP